jgi:thiol-disulfide isomerase/thioredoxin
MPEVNRRINGNNGSECVEDAPPTVSPNRSRRRNAIRWTLLLAVVLLAAYVALYLVGREKHWEEYVASGELKQELTIETPGGRTGKLIFGPAIWVERKADYALRDDAAVIVDDAITQARSEDKRVLLVFCTTSCLPCRYLDGLLSELSPILARHFVVVRIDTDVARNAHAVEFRYRDKNPPGGLYIPWYVVLDGTGKPLVTSDGPKGETGCALGPNGGRAYFLHMLGETAPRMTHEEMNEIDRLSKACRDRMMANASQKD